MHRCSTSPRLRRQSKDDDGFTLIELLVVITILGILAAIVVFAVKGIGDKGRSASIATDATVLKTAEEAYCAKFGTYGDPAADLVPAKFLTAAPTYNKVVLLNTGACGTGPKSGFIAGSTQSVPTSGELVLGASNVTPPFSFLSSSAPDPVTFSFGASSALAGTANTNSSPAVLFASADEANVNATIATGDSVGGNGSAGTCTGTCLGIGATKRLYAIGQLVGESCSGTGATLAPASGSPACKSPSGGYLATPATDMASLGAQLIAAAGATPTLKLAIADPGRGFVLGGSLGGTPTCTESGVPTAPYGVAAAHALITSTASGGAGLTCAQYGDMVCTGEIVGPGNIGGSLATAPSKEDAGFCAGDPNGKTADVTVTGNNVTTTQTKLVSGATHYALIPKSFVVAPGATDTDNVFSVPAGAHNPINQYAVVLNHTATTTARRQVGRTFLNYVGSPQGQAVMAQFGYDSIGTYTPILSSDVP